MKSIFIDQPLHFPGKVEGLCLDSDASVGKFNHLRRWEGQQVGTGDGGSVQLDLAGVFSPDSNSCITYMCVASHHSSAMLSRLFTKNTLLRTSCICPMRPAQNMGV